MQVGGRSNQSHLASLHTHVDLIGYTFLQGPYVMQQWAWGGIICEVAAVQVGGWAVGPISHTGHHCILMLT